VRRKNKDFSRTKKTNYSAMLELLPLLILAIAIIATLITLLSDLLVGSGNAGQTALYYFIEFFLILIIVFIFIGLILLGVAAYYLISFIWHRASLKIVLNKTEKTARSIADGLKRPINIISNLDELNRRLLRYLSIYRGVIRFNRFKQSESARIIESYFAYLFEIIGKQYSDDLGVIPLPQLTGDGTNNKEHSGEQTGFDFRNFADWVVDLDKLLFQKKSKDFYDVSVSSLTYFFEATIKSKIDEKDKVIFENQQKKVDRYYDKQEQARYEKNFLWTDAIKQVIIGGLLLAIGYLLAHSIA